MNSFIFSILFNLITSFAVVRGIVVPLNTQSCTFVFLSSFFFFFLLQIKVCNVVILLVASWLGSGFVTF